MNKNAEQIMYLYVMLEKEIRHTKNISKVGSVIPDYAKTLPDERKKMLDEIRNFRNQMAHASPQPQLPENHQEWISFLENEIKNLKKH